MLPTNEEGFASRLLATELRHVLFTGTLWRFCGRVAGLTAMFVVPHVGKSSGYWLLLGMAAVMAIWLLEERVGRQRVKELRRAVSIAEQAVGGNAYGTAISELRYEGERRPFQRKAGKTPTIRQYEPIAWWILATIVYASVNWQNFFPK